TIKTPVCFMIGTPSRGRNRSVETSGISAARARGAGLWPEGFPPHGAVVRRGVRPRSTPQAQETPTARDLFGAVRKESGELADSPRRVSRNDRLWTERPACSPSIEAGFYPPTGAADPALILRLLQ